MAAAPMEAQTVQWPSGDASSAPYPRWVTLRKELRIEVEGSSFLQSGDRKTLAAACTSTGNLIQVSLYLTEPPGISLVCLQIPDGLGATDCSVVAAHGDCVLIRVVLIEFSITENNANYITDHFVYSAGATAADPPSLSLLPPCGFGHPTGLVSRGGDVVVVGHVACLSAGLDTPELMRKADLSVFRSGEWSLKRLQIRFRDASEVPGEEELPQLWDAVVTVGDGLLCWVNYSWRLGVMLCNVLEETPILQYLRLPMENIWGPRSNRNVCATAGSSALKFVSVFPRCWCGGPGESSCERCCQPYTIETWTMRIGDDDMEWVMDGVVDSTELSALDSYNGLQRLPLSHPVVSLDQPELICFWLNEPQEDGLIVNVRSKTIHSVSRYVDGLSRRGGGLIPSSVSYFFNSDRQHDIDRPPPVIVDEQLIRDDNASNRPTTLQPDSFPEASVQASEIFEAFQEIPSYGLDLDELKVYRILSRDNCRLFRSFLRLPKYLRKDWLLMEIKASED